MRSRPCGSPRRASAVDDCVVRPPSPQQQGLDVFLTRPHAPLTATCRAMGSHSMQRRSRRCTMNDTDTGTRRADDLASTIAYAIGGILPIVIAAALVSVRG